MVFSQQVNKVYELQKICFLSCLPEIAFRKKTSECAVSGVCSFKGPMACYFMYSLI